MTGNQFRKFALSLPETEEKSHMSHPDFRVGGKIFATLLDDEKRAMVKLQPAAQQQLIDDAPELVEPANGAWGRNGATLVMLKGIDKSLMTKAIIDAWRNVAPKKIASLIPEDKKQ